MALLYIAAHIRDTASSRNIAIEHPSKRWSSKAATPALTIAGVTSIFVSLSERRPVGAIIIPRGLVRQPHSSRILLEYQGVDSPYHFEEVVDKHSSGD